MKNHKNTEFFELLLSNNEEKLKEWLIDKGKSGKAVCPVMFIKKEEIGNEEVSNGSK